MVNLEGYIFLLILVHIDVTRVFNSVLLQQTQMVDGNGDKTIAALYVTWWVITYRIGRYSLKFLRILKDL